VRVVFAVTLSILTIGLAYIIAIGVLQR